MAILEFEPDSLEKRLASYGCTDYIRLDEKLSIPAQLDYLDLLPKRINQNPPLTAVAENQGTAILYIVDACSNANCDQASIAELGRQLANRSDPAWLGVVRASSLEIYPIGFHDVASASSPVITIDESSKNAPQFFQALVHGTLELSAEISNTDYVYKKIFALLEQTTKKFVPQSGKGKLDALDVLSMAGRALFFRFLVDRRIVLPSELNGDNGICPLAKDLKDTFSSAEKAAQTSAWLDATFNGDFLPLINESIKHDNRTARERAYRAFFKRIEQLAGEDGIFRHLHAILRGWKAVGDDFQTEIDWGDLDFAHIPVGVLSQVYESFSHRAEPATARETSVHYTPRLIAKLMVDEAFAATKDPAHAMVLDASCGAGIFLVLAFRRLVRERWQEDVRPTTAVIQEILYGQLRGFDISEPALRLAALGLYITAIELNASQRPPNALKFPRDLRNTVLHRFDDRISADGKPSTMPLGSLGPQVPESLNGTFDIVIGNPPWTRLRDKDESVVDTKAVNQEFTKIARRVLAGRALDEPANSYQNPDKNPDLPFLWRAMEWAKPFGVIALAMPARLFGRTSGKGLDAWRAILQSIDVTGIINGANLRKTAVWETIDMPFCMFFARNSKPSSNCRFRYSAPSFEPNLNGDGRFRIDYESAQAVPCDRVAVHPWMLKALSLGTWRDVELMAQILNDHNQTLWDRWHKWDVEDEKSGQGYKLAREGSSPKYVGFLADLLDFEEPASGFSIQFEGLLKYGDKFGRNEAGESCADAPRRESLYQPPLALIPKAPGEDPHSPKAYLSSLPLSFSQSYYGYSCKGHPDAETLAAFIYLLAHSTLFRYYALMTSVSQGADHMIFTKQDFDSLPCPDITTFSSGVKSQIRKCATRLQSGNVKTWDEVDSVLYSIYGIDPESAEVIADTLYAASAYRTISESARVHTDAKSRQEFVGAMRHALQPYFEVCDEQLSVKQASFQPDEWREPWYFLELSKEGKTAHISTSLLQKAMEVANDRGCSRIIVRLPRKGGILFGLLNQRRWWTKTRARLSAQNILREHLSAFGLPEEA